jgi:hypothetical protein
VAIFGRSAVWSRRQDANSELRGQDAAGHHTTC